MPVLSPAALRARAPWILLWALLAALFGGVAARAVQLDRLDRPPPGWTLQKPELPVQLASLKQASSAAGWPLDSHNALLGDEVGTERIELEGTLPPGARLSLLFTDGIYEVGLELSRDGESQSRHLLRRDGRIQRMSCAGGPLPPPGEQVAAALQRTQTGVSLSMGTTAVHCQTPALGPGRARLEAGLRQVRFRRIVREGPGGTVVQEAGGSAAVVLGAALLAGVLGAVLGTVLPRVAVLAALVLGLAPGLLALELPRLLEGMRIVSDRPKLWAVSVPLALAGVVGLGLGAGALVRGARPLPRWLPVAGGAALGAFGIAAYGPGFGLLTVVLGAVGGGLLPRLVGRRWTGEQTSLGRLVVAAAVLGGTLGLGVLALRPRYGMAGAVAAEVGALAAVVLWANVRSVRGFNLISLACAVLMVFLTNHGLKWTAWGDRLVGRSARAGANQQDGAAAGAGEPDAMGSGAWSSFEALETTRQWTTYPDQDYPVAPAPRRPGALRIVALGGSSTGGAWQNDDLREFWPAMLQQRLGDRAQVLNLGVGGWTSFHVRHFLETRFEDVDPDIVVLYLGHNDAMTPSPVPYGALFQAWQQRRDWRVGLSTRLSEVPLYQALRFALVASIVDEDGVAVPPEDLDENIARIEALLRRREARLVLVLEGITPKPDRLAPWGAVMAAHAQAADVVYVDGAELLAQSQGAPVFLDACHLTERGHRLVAEAVDGALRQAGWWP